MKVLVVTNMYPTSEFPAYGIFVREQVESLRREGIDVDVFFVNPKKSKLNYLWTYPRFWAHLLTHHYDLIHSHHVLVTIMARAQLICPLILTHHSGEVYDKWERHLSRLISPLADKIIAVSQDTKEVGHLNNAEVIPCGTDFDLLKPMPQQDARKTLGLPLDKKLVLWAGAYSNPLKRSDIVQKSMGILKKRMPEVELVLVSDKPHSSMPYYMNACDVIFLVSDKEGSPQVIKEAMACNLPVVSVPAGDVPEVISNTEGCYLCSQDPEDVAEKLALALQFGKKTDGREKISHMEIGAIARRIISVYEDVLRQKKGRGLAKLWFWQKK